MKVEKKDILTIILGSIIGITLLYTWNSFRFDILQSIIVVFAIIVGVLLTKNKKSTK